MPKNDRQQNTANVTEVTVKLKSFLGMRPGLYLTVIYAVILVLLVFFLLFFPGLHNRGSYRTIVTFPEHAAVSVDGVYAGSTPCTIFLRHGTRSVEISKPYYTPVTFQEVIRGRVFATLIVPEKRTVRRSIAVADVAGLTRSALADFQRNPEIAQIVSEAALAAYGTQSQQQLYDFINNCMYFVANESQLKEVLLGAARVAARGTMLTPGSFVGLVQKFVHVKQKYDNLPSWLLLVLSRSNGNKLASSQWIQQYLAGYRDTLSTYYKPPALSPPSGGGGSVSLLGTAFRVIPQGTLVMGRDDNLDSFGRSVNVLLPHPVAIDQFYLATTEVTNAQYQTFLSETPEWAAENKPALVQKGLVNEGYLSSWLNGRFPQGQGQRPVTNVSWHAAVAFTQWLDRRAGGALPGYHAQLPSESQWEWAARGGLRGMAYPLGGSPGASVLFKKGITGPSDAGASEPNGYGLRDMLGNVWEWCSDPFSLSVEMFSSLSPRQNDALESALPDSPDRVVRGGSWANQPGVDKVYTRGYQPAEWCTPYLGFRVALARR
jgi:formylglycine-generating enzyme required for sulfatase activity